MRGLALLCTITKTLTTIVRRRFNPGILALQLGFRSGASCAMGIHALRSAIFSARTGGTQLFVTFIDLQKAFDSVPRWLLDQVLDAYGCDSTLRQLLDSLYQDVAHMRFPDGTFGRVFRPTQGVKQGDGISPLIFNLFLDIAFREALREMTGVELRNHITGALHLAIMLAYADDVASLAPGYERAQRNINALRVSFAKLNLTINPKKDKTEAMVVFPLGTNNCQRDTAPGYSSRMEKLKSHVDLYPDALTPVVVILESITSITLPRECGSGIRCPYIGCPYAARPTLMNPRGALVDHLQESHGFKRGNDCHHIADQGEIESGAAVDFGLPPCTPDPRPRENSTLHEAETEAMAAKPPQVQAPNLTVGDNPIHYVSVYKYLGSLVTYNASMAPEVNRRVQLSAGAFNRKDTLWTAEKIPVRTRAKIYQGTVLPVLLFASGTWNCTVKEITLIRKTYHRHLRRINHRAIGHAPESMEATFKATGAPTLDHLLMQARLSLAGKLRRRTTYSGEVAQWSLCEDQGKATFDQELTRPSWKALAEHDMQIMGTTWDAALDVPAWNAMVKQARWGPKGQTPRVDCPEDDDDYQAFLESVENEENDDNDADAEHFDWHVDE